MSNRFIDLLMHLASRERWLIAGLFGVVVPLGLFFAVLLPLQEEKSTQVANRTEAIALNLWVQERVRENALIAQVTKTDEREAIGPSGVEQSLITAGLRDAITELSGSAEGTIDLQFDAVRFTRLMGWLSQIDPVWGYDIAQFRFESRLASGYVTARLTLTPQSR